MDISKSITEHISISGLQGIYANDIEKRQANRVKHKPRIFLSDQIFAETHYPENRKGTAYEVASIGHPKGIYTQHDVAESSASDGCGHTHYPCSEDVELLGTGQADA